MRRIATSLLMQRPREPVGQRPQHLQPRVVLIVAFDQRPWRLPRARVATMSSTAFVRFPLLAIAPVLVGQLPALVRQALALLEAPQLLVLADVHPVFTTTTPWATSCASKSLISS